MKRRSFIGRLLATITAAFALPWIPKPADPELEMIMPSSTIITRNAEGFEIGDMVYWDGDEKCLKVCQPNYPPQRYQRVMGFVSKEPMPNVFIAQPKYKDRIEKVLNKKLKVM